MNRLIEKLNGGMGEGTLRLCQIEKKQKTQEDFFKKITNYKKLTVMSEFRTLAKLIEQKGDLRLDLTDYE